MEETHATTTDTFGLFTLTIGQGTNTTNGVQASFADISWGTNTHFLKIEMDVTGGSTYSNMGTNQMMSVPYALYAESANLDYDSIANYLSGDSTFVTNISSGLGGGGCNYQFPEGLDGESITSTCTYSNPYIVPTNKRLIVLLTDNNPEINGVQLPDINGGEVLILNSGDALSPWYGIGDLDFHGILIEPTTSVTSITLTCTYSNPYIVPTNKRLIVLLTDNNSEINGVQLPDINNGEVLILNSGDTFSPWYGIGDLDFNGYLADDNYFAGCGGSSDGGNSDSNNGGAGGCDYNYPDGLNGEPIYYDFTTNNHSYSVPSGKNLYINLIEQNTGDDILINSKKIHDSGIMDYHLNVILSEGDVIEIPYGGNTSEVKNMFGTLVDKQVQSLTHDIIASGPYTVPNGKKLYLYKVYPNEGGTSTIAINSMEVAWEFPVGSSHHKFLVVGSADVITPFNSNASICNIFGYLADEDYFADCGGGGSSNSGTGNMVVSTFGDTLTMNGQSIIVPGISFSNVVPVFGSVTDIDGNTYPTVSYGNVEWMTENLTTTTFSDGTSIPQICNVGTNPSLSPGWCYYDNNPASAEASFGKLYNGHVIASQTSQNVCPTGWSVPSQSEWELILELFGDLDGISSPQSASYLLSGRRMKSDTQWDGTNESYLSLVPSGINNSNGSGSSIHRYWANDVTPIFDPIAGNYSLVVHLSVEGGSDDASISWSPWWTYSAIRCKKD